ncbi:MAG TPA: sugar-binding protein [Melioribacteraceae bacterium]|nr:sugar-binding protein [Melioribacteraceae bacterium]
MKYFFTFLLLSTILIAQNKNSVTFNDTLFIKHSDKIPVVDGIPNDEIWETINWEPIDQVWMTYGENIDKSDFNGFYKICWNEETNLLYFLVKTHDDYFVDGYKYSQNPAEGKNYPDFDILEIFIDEDLSGGLHVFNSKEEINLWGSNSVNAFTHHMVINKPDEGQTVTLYVDCDIEGISWEDYFIIDYKNHFNNYKVKRTGDEYCWEFSMGVYSDKYKHDKPEDSRVKLYNNKSMGLSLAYCDNDGVDESPKTRDNFFGSVYVEPDAYNDHWKDANGYRKVVLVK